MELAIFGVGMFVFGTLFGLAFGATNEGYRRRQVAELREANEKLIGLVLAKEWADGLPGAQMMGVSNLTKDWGKRFDWNKLEEQTKPQPEIEPGGIEVTMGV